MRSLVADRYTGDRCIFWECSFSRGCGLGHLACLRFLVALICRQFGGVFARPPDRRQATNKSDLSAKFPSPDARKRGDSGISGRIPDSQAALFGACDPLELSG